MQQNDYSTRNWDAKKHQKAKGYCYFNDYETSKYTLRSVTVKLLYRALDIVHAL